jgi:O-antigen/teichoic acid export membrane protein
MTDRHTDTSFVSASDPLAEAESPSGPEFWKSRAWWRRAGETSAASWISTGFAFLGTVVAARALGAEDFGSVVLALSVASLVATFLDLTLEEAVVHHGTRALVAGDLPGLRALLRRSIGLDILVGAFVSGAIFLLAAPLADLASAGRLDPTLLRLAALSVLVVTADSTTSAVLLVAGRPQLRAWSAAATNLLRLVGVVVAVELGGPEAVVASYVVVSAAGSVLQGTLAWRAAWRGWARASKIGTSPVSASKLLRFGLHSSLTTSLSAVSASLIPVLLGRLAGPAAVGIFRVAMLPIFAADTLSGPLRLVLLPEQARLSAEGNVHLLRRAMIGYTLIGLTVGVCGAVVGWFALPWLIPFVYSSEFDDAVLPARILLIAAVCHFALAWGKSFFAAIGRPELRTVISGLFLVLTGGLLLLFGDEGSKGAAIAFSSATVVMSVAWTAMAYRLLAREARSTESRVSVP